MSAMTIAVAALSACSSPRVALGASAVTTSMGLLVVLVPSHPMCSASEDLCGYGEGITRVAFSSVLLTTGVALLFAGLYGHEPPGSSPALPPPRELPDGRRGFFCVRASSHPALAMCTRDSVACNHARQILAIPEPAACVPAETAWCFDVAAEPRCFATRGACELQQGRAEAAVGVCSAWR